LLHRQVRLIDWVLVRSEPGKDCRRDIEWNVREYLVGAVWKGVAQEVTKVNGHIRVIAKRPLEPRGQPRVFFDGDDLTIALGELPGDEAFSWTNFIDGAITAEVESVEESGDQSGISQKVLG
jgi:hypothetical protein